MPYPGVPAAATRRMERCVTRVMSQGHDKSAAIAICHASIVKRKERRAARLLTLKAPNYSARAGETIAGALGRGAGGQFVRADGSAASGRETVNALTARAKKPKGSGKPKRTDAEAAATGEQAGIDSEDFSALNAFAKGTQPSEGDANRLVRLGLAERGKDGTLRLAGSSRSLLRAAASGDVQGAKDALSKARDKKAGEAEREGKRQEREAAQVGKRAAAESKRSERQARVEQQRAERASKRKTAEMQKATDRLEEIEAVASSDKSVTEAERVKRLNQLDALDRRIEAAGGNPELSKRSAALRKKLSGDADSDTGEAFIPLARTNKEHGSFTVFKQADGSHRWLAVTSNSYRDRDGEIVTQKALEADAERMTESGEYGPLRFWHVGKVVYDKPLDWSTAKAGPGLDIGTTDFSVMHGRMSVEGGEVFPQFAQGLAGNEWQVSRGFAHPMGHPVAKAYDKIRSFERSPLPMGSASNPFTSLTVTEDESMANLEDKMKEFAAKFFGGDVTKAKAYADDLTKTDKEIEAKGIAFKEGETTTTTAEAPATTTEAKAEGDAPEAEAAAEGDADAVFVGDMLADEFASLLTKSISEALAPMLTAQAELGKRIEAAETATKEMREVDRATHEAVTSVLKGFVTTKEATDKSMAAIDARVKELEGDAPGQGKGYRASADAATITQKQMKQAQPPDELARMAAFLFGGQPPDAGASA